VKRMLLLKDAADEKNAILEIRAGHGGDEAALFAADLFRMYQRYAAEHGWRFESWSSPIRIGGYKEAIATVSGRGVFARLKFESGVHRVAARAGQRGLGAHPHLRGDRRGAAEAEEFDVKIDEKDCAIDVFRSPGQAGSRSTRPDSACAHHPYPTGVVSASRTKKSQHKNRARR